MRVLLQHAELIATLDEHRREWRDGSVMVNGTRIERVDSAAGMAAWMAADPAGRTPERTVDLRGCVLIPGLVNGHHHLFQTLTRTVGTSAGLGLFDWLKRLYPIWGRMDAEAVTVSASLGLAELLLSGATTVADHLHLYPPGLRMEHEIEAAQALGVRFHPTRGSMSVGESQGGLPPDRLVEQEPAILADSLRLIEQYHDAAPGSMLRVGLAPCSPFSVSADLMRESARLARAHPGVSVVIGPMPQIAPKKHGARGCGKVECGAAEDR